MTSKADFTTEEWETIAEAPTSAGMLMVVVQRGGTFRETYSMAKAYVAAREHFADDSLVAAIVEGRPQVEKPRHDTLDEVKTDALGRIGAAVALLEQKATPEELADFRELVLDLAGRVADAAKGVSPEEEATLAEIAEAVGAPGV